MSDMKISRRPDDVLVTHSLGSCVGLSLFDPVAKIGGLIHCVLPMSMNGKAGKNSNPFVYVDSGVTRMLMILFKMGATNEALKAKVAGAANILDDSGAMNIGDRNYAMLKKVLWKHDIQIDAADIGGRVLRSMSLRLKDGTTRIKFGKVEVEI